MTTNEIDAAPILAQTIGVQQGYWLECLQCGQPAGNDGGAEPFESLAEAIRAAVDEHGWTVPLVPYAGTSHEFATTHPASIVQFQTGEHGTARYRITGVYCAECWTELDFTERLRTAGTHPDHRVWTERDCNRLRTAGTAHPVNRH